MTVTDIGLLVLRMTIGLTFAAHGAQKAFGWWGGPGRQRWRGAVEAMGFVPAGLFAGLAIASELVGGVFLAIGFLTPLAAAALVAQSVVIIARAHWAKGFFSTAGGYEFPLSLGISAAVLGLLGPGPLSVDGALGLQVDLGLRVSLLILGFIGGLVAVAVPGRVVERASRGGLRRT